MATKTVATVESKLRSYLRKLASGRKNRTVSADDVHRFVTRNNLNLTPNQIAALARKVLGDGGNFYQTGWILSNRPAARSREITLYRAYL